MTHQLGFEFRQLETFCCLAETLHFRRAAERLHLAQSAVSRQIGRLERAVGFPLFERGTRSVALTPAGAAFRDHVAGVLLACQTAVADARDVAAGRAGRLRVAFSGPTIVSGLADLLRRFRAAHPELRLDIGELPTSEQIVRLDRGELDVGFFLDQPLPRTLSRREILRSRACVGVPADHPLAGRTEIALRELADERLILFPRSRNPHLYDFLLGQVSDRGRFEVDVVEASSRIVAAGMVAAGLGIATFAETIRAFTGPAVAVIPQAEPRMDAVVVTGWRRATGNPFLALLDQP